MSWASIIKTQSQKKHQQLLINVHPKYNIQSTSIPTAIADQCCFLPQTIAITKDDIPRHREITPSPADDIVLTKNYIFNLTQNSAAIKRLKQIENDIIFRRNFPSTIKQQIVDAIKERFFDECGHKYTTNIRIRSPAASMTNIPKSVLEELDLPQLIACLSELTHQCHNVARHINVHESLLQFMDILKGYPSKCADSCLHLLCKLRGRIAYDPVQLVINDMIHIRTNQKQHGNAYFLRLKTCLSVLECVAEKGIHLEHIYGSFPRLLYTFVVDPSSDEQERSIILDFFYSFLMMTIRMHRRSYDTFYIVRQFYKQHFEPAVLNCRENEDYSLLSQLFFLFTQFYSAVVVGIYKHEFVPPRRVPSKSLQKTLSLDDLTMAKYILNAHALYDRHKITDEYNEEMLPRLQRIVEQERETGVRIDILTEENKITDEFKCCLKDIFGSFATNADGSMSPDDFQRYIRACGCIYRWRCILTGGGAMHLLQDPEIYSIFTLDSFCAFYACALEDGVWSVKSVWNDLYAFGYNNQLAKGDQVQNVQPVYQFLKRDDKYNDILSQFCDIYRCMRSRSRALPLPEIMRKRIVELDNMADFLDCNDGFASLDQLVYNLSNLESLCVVRKDYEWKQTFIRSKAWDHLIKLTLKLACIPKLSYNGSDVNICFCTTMLFRIMYHLCSASTSSPFMPLQRFIRNAYDLDTSQKDLWTDIGLLILNRQQNYLINLMVMDAKQGIEHNIGLLNVIPYEVTRVYSEVLICGFIATCQFSHQNIPQALLDLMCSFF
eukprot:681021_1